MNSERVIRFPGGDNSHAQGIIFAGGSNVGGRGGADFGSSALERRMRRHMYLVSVQHQAAGGLYSRLVVLDAGLSIADAADAILTCYGWPERVERQDYHQPHAVGEPWSFRISGRTYAVQGLDGVESMGTSLWQACEGERAVGMTGLLVVGEFYFSVTVVDHRDVRAGEEPCDQAEDTISRALGLHGVFASHGGDGLESVPDAKLVSCDYVSVRLSARRSGSASSANSANSASSANSNSSPALRQHPLKIRKWPSVAEINVELAGEATVEHVLGAVKPELRRWLESPESCEFLPLLQSLDLDRPAVVSEQAAELLADAPVEHEPKARAAAWAHIIALSTLVKDDDAERVREAFMTLAGYPGTSANDVRELCTRTRKVLAMAGADSWSPSPVETTVPLVQRSSLVDRLEMYRFLLQH